MLFAIHSREWVKKLSTKNSECVLIWYCKWTAATKAAWGLVARQKMCQKRARRGTSESEVRNEMRLLTFFTVVRERKKNLHEFSVKWICVANAWHFNISFNLPFFYSYFTTGRNEKWATASERRQIIRMKLFGLAAWECEQVTGGSYDIGIFYTFPFPFFAAKVCYCSEFLIYSSFFSQPRSDETTKLNSTLRSVVHLHSANCWIYKADSWVEGWYVKKLEKASSRKLLTRGWIWWRGLCSLIPSDNIHQIAFCCFFFRLRLCFVSSLPLKQNEKQYESWKNINFLFHLIFLWQKVSFTHHL